MSSLRVLLTNITLAGRSGTEIYVRDVALGLLARGHRPVVYTSDPGSVADEIGRATIPVVSDVSQIGLAPDVIHGHHHPETMLALLQFPRVPAVFVSHDALAWHDAAPRFPRIRRYVAVDEATFDRIVLGHGVPPARVRVVHNAVDLARFRPRGPLPSRPARALVFSNYASDGSYLARIREACTDAGLALDVVGGAAGTQASAPEEILGGYDLVFGKARCALEAMAVGAAVILCDYGAVGPMVTRATVDDLRRQNFGRRLLQRPLSVDALRTEIGRYDAADATAVRSRIRATAALDPAVDELVGLYREIIAEQAESADDPHAEHRAVAAYLREWGPRFKDGALRSEIERLRGDLARAVVERDAVGVERDAVGEELVTSRHALDVLWTERNALAAAAAERRSDLVRVQAELDGLIGSATWRLRATMLRLPLVGAFYRALRTKVLPRVVRARLASRDEEIG